MPAGRQDSSYALRVGGFNWDNFYGPLGGRNFLETVKAELRSEYDYILIDSRTGMSDTSGICTVQMPDTLVVCLTMNAQSMQGSASVAFSVKNQRPVDPVTILPVPMRVDFAEKDILDRARGTVREAFAPVLTEQTRTNEYWGMVEFPYEPFYTFSEVLAPFGDRPFSTRTLLAAATNLTKMLTDGRVTKMEPLSEKVRQTILQKFQ